MRPTTNPWVETPPCALNHQTAPLQWYLFGLGVLLSLILRMTGVPPLAFALGMHLPMELNTPVLLGGILSWMVARRGRG